jgi:hypothetical protein
MVPNVAQNNENFSKSLTNATLHVEIYKEQKLRKNMGTQFYFLIPNTVNYAYDFRFYCWNFPNFLRFFFKTLGPLVISLNLAYSHFMVKKKREGWELEGGGGEGGGRAVSVSARTHVIMLEVCWG